MRQRLLSTRWSRFLFTWLLLALLLTACGERPTNPPATNPPQPVDDLHDVSPVATVAGVQYSPLPPTPTATPVREALRLVVLHTNDNWGETEPCG